MRSLYPDKEKENAVLGILSDEKLKNKMLKDFGFDAKNYSAEEFGYIMCSITECGGLTDKVKAAKALYIVDQIAKFCSMHNKYEEVGAFAMDLLRDCKVINFTE